MTGVIVAGMHRSGTSLTTKMLRLGGWHPGEATLSRDGEAYEEDAAFVELHRKWLGETLPEGEGHRDWGVSGGGVVDLGLSNRSERRRRVVEAREFVAARDVLRDRWVAKDPRATLFLPVWAKVRGLRFVLVYRSPWDVVNSALHLGAGRFCSEPDIVRRAWLDHNRRIVEFASAHRRRCLVVASEMLTSRPDRVWSAVNDFVGLTGGLPSDLLDSARYTTRREGHPVATLHRQLYPEHARVLDELDRIADIPRPAPPRHTARSLRALPGGTLPEGTGVQVIVPCRNDGAFLVEALASADVGAIHLGEALGRDAVELTIVDDGSTDPETLRVLDRLRIDHRHVLTTPGVGLSAARNSATATSRTAAVLPLDADNRLHPELFEAVTDIERNEVDVVHGSWRRFGMDESIVTPPEMVLESLVPSNTIDACALISRRTLERLEGWDESLPFWEDWDLWLGVVELGARARRLDTITFDYLVRPSSLSSRALTEPDLREAVTRRVRERHQSMFDAVTRSECPTPPDHAAERKADGLHASTVAPSASDADG